MKYKIIGITNTPIACILLAPDNGANKPIAVLTDRTSKPIKPDIMNTRMAMNAIIIMLVFL